MLPVLTLILMPSIWFFNSLAVSSQRSARAGDAPTAATSASVAASKIGRRNCGPKAIFECPFTPLNSARGFPARAARGSQLDLDGGFRAPRGGGIVISHA